MESTLSDREIDERKQKRWKRVGKGKGNRWLMLRDLVGYCAIRPWTTTELEDVHLVRRGIMHRTTYQMIQELERARALETFSEERGQYWRATEQGVASFLVKRSAMPATFVQAVLDIKNVFGFEDSKNRDVE